MPDRAPKGQRSTSWDELGWKELPNGIRSSHYQLNEDDPSSPTVFRTYFPPGCSIPTHSHDVDYTEIILEGSQEVARRWHHAGDVRIVRAGTAYGPLVAGPEVTVMLVFATGDYTPTPVGGEKVPLAQYVEAVQS